MPNTRRPLRGVRPVTITDGGGHSLPLPADWLRANLRRMDEPTRGLMRDALNGRVLSPVRVSKREVDALAGMLHEEAT